MGEGQPRQIEAGAQKITDPGGAIDRQAGALKMRDVAVDRAGADLQRAGKVSRPASGRARNSLTSLKRRSARRIANSR